ncbi:MAG: glycerol-3-phosphate dehydrogenase/oxidase [Methylococcales bacterium]|nr:glycerol-3-phosphate dehydrogenase/oxidase [Methylococcales bacterium]
MMRRDFTQLTGRSFDAVICGGGIYGAWCAYDAALRGLKVALVDQGDWAGATSSASSKLIHGGLRYLELFDFKLVGKTLKERQLLLHLAPHRVWPLRFGIPVCRGGRLGWLQLKLGLFIYDLLAGIAGSNQAHQSYSPEAFAMRFPSLSTNGLTGGFSYLDAQTDDARLVLELVDGAQSAGAACMNYCGLTGTIETGGQISAVILKDEVSNEMSIVRTRHLIKATGPWQAATEVCRLTKGVHLILPKLPEDEAILLTAKTDGRVFFIIPWYGATLVGTTDTDFSGDIDQVSVEAGDVEYLLSEANRVLKTVQWTEQDIAGRFAGLRVLKADAKTPPSAVSRDWALSIADNGAMTSIGGKITSARTDAANIIDCLCQRLGRNLSCATAARPFPWAPATGYEPWAASNSLNAKRLGIDAECTLWLLRRYGNRVAEIFQIIEQEPYLAVRILPNAPFIKAELAFCAANEMVVHLDDLLRRRIPLLIMAKISRQQLRQLAGIAATELHWDTAAVNDEIARCLQKWPVS